jgi:hypothetical protein
LLQPFTASALSAIAITYWYGATKPGILAALLPSLIGNCFFEHEINTGPAFFITLCFWSLRCYDLGYPSAK